MSLRFTDSHCHLAMHEDADAAIGRARESGIAGFLVPGTHSGDAPQAVAVAERHPDVWAAVGFHPHEAKDASEEAMAAIEKLAASPRVVAIGEIGLDYHYDHSPRDVQREVFVRHLSVARELDLPVIIHNRESTEDLLGLLTSEEANGTRGVLHSYTESYEVASRLLDLGYVISFSGIVTFRTADMLRDVARRLPHDRVLIETDTPYLAPVPLRGKTNEPAYVIHVANRLAELWNVPLEVVAAATTATFERTFGVTLP